MQYMVELLPDIEQDLHIFLLLEKLYGLDVVPVEVVLHDVVNHRSPSLVVHPVVLCEQGDQSEEGDLAQLEEVAVALQGP